MFSLGDLRRYSDHPVAKFVIFALAGSFFIGFGVISFSGNSGFVDGAVVAYVAGEPITNRDLAIAYDRMYRNYREQLGDQLTEDLLKKLNLRFQALNALINQQVLAAKAREFGFEVGDEELAEYIAEIPAFQGPDGRFDPQRYRALLAQQRPPMKPRQFEEETRRQLLVGKLEAWVKAMVHVSEEELLREFLLDTQETNLEYLVFDASEIMQRIRPTASEIEAYYQEHLDEFITGEQADIRLIRADLDKIAATIDVDESVVRDYYEKNIERYRHDAGVRASHILIKVDADAGDEAVAEARERAMHLLKQIQGGADFAELARQYSEDRSTGRRGGELGWFRKGQMVKPFEEAAFATPPGEVTGPVRSRFGFHIIRVEDRKDAGVTPFADVHDAIVEEIIASRAREKAAQLIDDILARVREGTPLDQALADAGDVILDERLRIRSSEPGADGLPAGIWDVVFAEDRATIDGQPLEVETNEGGAIVVVTNRLPSEPRPLEEVRDEIVARIRESRALTIAAERATKALEDLRKGDSITRVARRYGTVVQETGSFTARDEEIPGIGKNPDIRNAAFTLTPEQPLPRTSLRSGQAYYVIRLKERREPTREDWLAERDVRKVEATNSRRDEIWRAFVRYARTGVDIELENPPADLLPSG